MEINKIMVLGNGEEYLVIDNVDIGNDSYFYIAEVNEDGTGIKDNYKIVTVLYKEGSSYIEEIIGEEKLKSILPAFVEKFS